jgi:hypothetical protein
MVCAIAAGAPRAAAQATLPANPTERAETGQALKVFDFDERPLGNYENTPMYWRRMTGEGFPAYSDGQFDEQVGHKGPPSFRFTLRGGNIGYEYQHDDLSVSPDSDYLVEAYVRADGLEHARAFVASYVVDASGVRIAGSERISQLVRSQPWADPAADGTWQRVEIPLYTEDPGAASLRLQLWVLQTYVFDEPDRTAVDPITPQDVNARVWFDDLAIVRLPRVALSFSNPGGLIKPGADEALQVAVQNTTPVTLAADLTVVDESGAERLRTTLEAAPGATEQFRVQVPELPPGTYRADVRALAPDDVRGGAPPVTFTHRTIRFAMLPELGEGTGRCPDFGVDLGEWPAADPTGAAQLITTLGCGAAKIGLSMTDLSTDRPGAERLRQARDLAQRMAVSNIEMTGVILPRHAATSVAAPTLYDVVTADDAWEEQLGPLLASFGGHLSSWQLGAEAAELNNPRPWNRAALSQFRRRLERYTAILPLVLPCAVLDAAATPALLDPTLAASGRGASEGPGALAAAPGFDVYSFWVPAGLPAWNLPWQLAFACGPRAAQGNGGAKVADEGNSWVSLELPRDEHTSQADRLTDLARRMTLAKAVHSARVYVGAPFELTASGGRASWQPTDEYLPLRTLMHELSGAQCVAALPLTDDAIAVLFERGDDCLLVAWTWQAGPGGTEVELYTGPAATAITLAGTACALELRGPRARLTLLPMPLILRHVDGPLLCLQNSFRVEPALIQLQDSERPPTLTLTNPYSTELSGSIELRAPATWQVTPNPVRLQLRAGDTLSQPLSFEVPPRQVASAQNLDVVVHLQRPHPADLHFQLPLQVGLRNIVALVTTSWDGPDLVVEHLLQNLSDRAVSFSSFCQPPGRAQLEGVFLNVPSGSTAVHAYRLVNARDLVGSQLWLGIEEIGGQRALDQLVVVTP